MAPPLYPVEAVWGEEAGIIADVMVEGQGSGQERDRDRGEMPPELVGEKRLVQGWEPRLDKAKPWPTVTRQHEVVTQ